MRSTMHDAGVGDTAYDALGYALRDERESTTRIEGMNMHRKLSVSVML